MRELLSYERVVVTPSQITNRQISQLHNADIRVYGYLSVGEWDNSLGQVPANSSVLTQNTDWNASVMDMQDPDWQNHLLSEADVLLSRGFDGLFLDTLDSYMLAELPASALSDQQIALIDTLNALSRDRENETAVELILNRGFDLIDRLAFQPQAVVAESMINGYNAAFDSYYPRTSEDTQWVTDRLNEVKAEGIEAIVIDYLPSEQHQARIDAARQLAEAGFTPYISNGLLTDMGVSTEYPIPRRVLIFYNGSEYLKKQSLCHRFLAVLVEYSGYVPECFDANLVAELYFDPAKYAGVVYWLSQGSYNNTRLVNFIQNVLDRQDVRSLFIGELPESRNLLEQLHLQAAGSFQGKLTSNLDQLGYRMPTSSLDVISRYVLAPGVSGSDVSVNVEITDANGASGIGLMKTLWGGVVTEALTVQELMGDRIRWSLEPFEHILPLLELPEIPVPDVTTESGQRILTAHIDGDGFPSMTYTGQRVFAGESVRQEILNRYQIPQTVSVIEAEVAPHGLFPMFSDELKTIARNIFQMEHVEVASHTFSHPFFWDERVAGDERMYGDSLDVPGYKIDYDREVFGSVKYIENELIPAGSNKKVNVFLWSGAADPTADIIEKTQQLGMYNVNGGNTYVVNSNFSIAQVYPHLNWYPNAVQVYAPLMNENLYTDLWTDNYNGYSRAIESFELLGEPRRLKPISIYYHMYSGVYPSSLRALRQVYDWAISQPHTPMFLSEYAARASALYETGFAKSLFTPEASRQWNIISTGIRSLRVGQDWVPTASSEGIAGFTPGPDGNYLTLTGSRSTLKMAETSQVSLPFDGIPYMKAANGVLHRWEWQGNTLLVEIDSHTSLRMTMAQTSSCQLQQNSPQLQVQQASTDMEITSTAKGRHSFALHCQ